MKSYLVSDFKSDISGFREVLMKVKSAMFNDKIGINSINYNVATKNLRNSLNDLLRDWEKSGTDSLKIFSRYVIKDDNTPTAMSYNFFKEMVYADFDYESTVGFISGIQQGIAEEVIRNSENIADFKASTIQQAFNGLWPDTSEVLREFIDGTETKNVLSDLEIQMLKTIQGRAMTVLDLRDRHALHQSIMSAIGLLNPILNSQDNPNLNIAIITNAFEYMFFAVIAYIGRIMTINTMVSDLVTVANAPDTSSDVDKVITESVLSEAEVPEYAKECPIEGLRMMDLSLFRDPNSFKEFFDKLCQLHDHYTSTKYTDYFTQSTDWNQTRDACLARLFGIDPKCGTNARKNMFLAALDDYRLDIHTSSEIGGGISRLKEFHDVFEDAILAPLNGMQQKPSPFREIVHCIAHADYGKDVKSLHTLLSDLCIFTDKICRKVRERINQVTSSWSANDVGGVPKNTLGSQKLKAETTLLLTKAYQELMYVIYLRAMYLCRELNDCSHQGAAQFDKITALNPQRLIGPNTPTSTLGDYMQAGMPDGLKMLNWNESFDALTEYEALTLYDEYVQTLPGFASDVYFTEAGSDLINTMISMIVGLFNSAAAFFGKFEPAANWVTKHESELKALEFSNDTKMEEIIPYKISNTDKYIGGLNKLKSVDVKTAVKDLDKFTEDLYGDATVYKWFKTDASTAPKKFENLVLYGITSESADDVKTITLTGSKITEAMAEWVDDVKSSTAIVDKLKAYTSEFKAAINNLKSAGTQYVKESTYYSEADDSTPPENVPEADVSADNKTGTSQDKKPDPNKPAASKTDENKSEVTADEFNNLLMRANKAMSNLCKPLYSGVAKAVRDEYGYIKKAYSLAKKSTSPSGESGNSKDGTV